VNKQSQTTEVNPPSSLPIGFNPTHVLEDCGVPSRFACMQLKQMEFEIAGSDKKRHLKWEGGFILSGMNGQGKSSWAAAAIKDRMHPDHPESLAVVGVAFFTDINEPKPAWVIPRNSIRWYNFPLLVAEMQNVEIGKHGNREYFLDRIMAPTVVVFDDFGKQRSSDYTTELVYSLIDKRYGEKGDIIVTTNNSYQEISTKDNANASRFRSLTAVTLPDEDRRGEHKWG